jgi:hypothetical protein
VFTVGRRRCPTVDALLDDPAEHNARRTIDDVADLDYAR